MMSEKLQLKEFIDDLIILTQDISNVAPNPVKKLIFKKIYETQTNLVNKFYHKWKEEYPIELGEFGIRLPTIYQLNLPISFYLLFNPFNSTKLTILNDLFDLTDTFESYFLKVYDQLMISSTDKQLKRTTLECLREFLFIYDKYEGEFLIHLSGLKLNNSDLLVFKPIYLEKYPFNDFKEHLNGLKLRYHFIPNLMFWRLGIALIPISEYKINSVKHLPFGEILDQDKNRSHVFIRLNQVLHRRNPYYYFQILDFKYTINPKYFLIMKRLESGQYDSLEHIFSLFSSKDFEIISVIQPEWENIMYCNSPEMKPFQINETKGTKLYDLISNNFDIVINIFNLLWDKYSELLGDKDNQEFRKIIYILFPQLGLIHTRLRPSYYTNNVIIEIKGENRSKKGILDNLREFFSFCFQSIMVRMPLSIIVYTWIPTRHLPIFFTFSTYLESLGIEINILTNHSFNMQQSYQLPASSQFDKTSLTWDFTKGSNYDLQSYKDYLLEEELIFHDINKERVNRFIEELLQFL